MKTPFQPNDALYPARFLWGSGEMKQLIRDSAWQATTLGPIESWPASLYFALRQVLSNPQPMALCWGTEAIFFYNDAFAALLGPALHPTALGSKTRQIPQLWQSFGKAIDSVIQTGGSYTSIPFLQGAEKAQDPISHNRIIQYCPVIDEDETIAGISITCTEDETISDYQKTQAEKEKEIQNIFSQSSVNFAVYEGPEFIVKYINENALRSWGKTMAEVIGRSIFEISPEVRGTQEAFWQSVYETGVPVVAQEYLAETTRNGKLYQQWFDFEMKPLRDDTGKITGLLNVSIDVTEKVLARKKVEESEARFRSVIADAPAAIGLFVGPDLVIEHPNQTFIDIVGKGWDVVGKPLKEAMPELVTEGQPYLQILNDVYTTGQIFQTSGSPVKIRVNGTLTNRYYNFTYSPLFDADGQVWAILDIAIDVTEQIIAQQKVEASETQFRTLIEEAPVATCLFVGQEFKIEIANEKIIAIMGKGPTVVGRPLAEAIPELLGQPFLQQLDEVRRTGKTFESRNAPGELVVDGKLQTFYFDYIFKPLVNAAGEVYAVLDMTIDVTNNVLANRKLQESEERFRTLAETVPLIVYTADPDGIIDYYNKRWYEYTGSAKGLVEQDGLNIMHPDEEQEVTRAWNQAMEEQSNFKMEFRLKNKETGVFRWFLGQALPVFNNSGAVIKWFGTATDIQDQKNFSENLERQVAERTRALQQSNEDLQQFAHVVSHDLKEPIRKMRIFQNMLLTESKQHLSEKALGYLAKMENASKRLLNMIQGVLQYASLNGDDQTKEEVCLSSLMEEIETDLEIVISDKGAKITYSDLPCLDGFYTLLYQLFYNLINNALKFTKPDTPPVITIDSKETSTIEPSGAEQTNFLITVKDNGIGFAQEYAAQIFSTFSRLHAKDKYEGTGLGLALCKKIVERHGGSIWAEGTLGEGATFYILLPFNRNVDV